MNIKILYSWAFKALTNSSLKVQYKHFSILLIFYCLYSFQIFFSLINCLIRQNIFLCFSSLGTMHMCFSFWLETQAVLQSLSSSPSIGFISTKSKSSLLCSAPWPLDQAMQRGLYLHRFVPFTADCTVCGRTTYYSWPEHPLSPMS